MRPPFEGLLGNTGEMRLIEYLLPLGGIEYTADELAEEVKVSLLTISGILKKFVVWGIVNQRIEKDSLYYSINQESPIIQLILRFNNILIENILGEEKLYEIYDYGEKME